MKIRNDKNNNKKNAKKALALSMMSGALCFAMLAGSTYAWFTDSASGSNIIATGNLDVELKHLKDGNPEKVDANTKLFLSAATSEGEDGTTTPAAIKWEPGAVAYETFVVENAGSLNLTFDFALGSQEAGVWYDIDDQGNQERDFLREHLKVAILPAVDADGNVAAVEITRGADGKIYADGTEITGWETLNVAEKETGTLVSGATTAYTVVVWWEPDVTNVIDNRFNLNNDGKATGDDKTVVEDVYELTLNVELTATQAIGDVDGIDGNYDNGAYDNMVNGNVDNEEETDPFGG